MKSLTMWSHDGRTCTFVYGGYEQPVLRLVYNSVLVREVRIVPGAAVSLSELWEVEIPIPRDAACRSAFVPRARPDAPLSSRSTPASAQVCPRLGQADLPDRRVR